MSRWLSGILARVRALASAGRVRFTHKALRELAGLGLGLDHDDCCEVLRKLTTSDSAGRIESGITGEWMYVFKPSVAGMRLYLKLILRADCIVVSFHEEGVEDVR